jgi:coenzyme F420-dependent glucose-6-phosphate dehydrogenase
MTAHRVGFHASHEQFSPRELLELVGRAERAGFGAAMCSDHLQPWSASQGQSGFAWSWLGAAMATTDLSFGTVTAPGQRYHPAIVAQAIATLGEMFPGRFWCALGSGEALNEAVTGDRFPARDERNARLRESAGVIRALLAGETVSHDGLITVKEARLWTLPATTPQLLGAAVTEETARWVAGWADGLITVARPGDALRRVVDAFRDGGGGSKPMYLQAHVAYSENDAAARDAAFDQWRTPIFESPVLAALPSPAAFDAAAQFVRPDDVDGPVRISSDASRHVDWLGADFELGFDRVYVHHVGRDQAAFIDRFGTEVLPQLR